MHLGKKVMLNCTVKRIDNVFHERMKFKIFENTDSEPQSEIA